LPAAKWEWFKASLNAGQMMAFDPRTAVPEWWSLKPEDSHSLVFWTKNPHNLLLDHHLLKPYRVKIHMTLTGWEEVEKGAPLLKDALRILEDTVTVFGAENVTWRFSPVPVVEDVVDRFGRICARASRAGIREVYVSFLQENDLMPEPRSPTERESLLKKLGERADVFGIKVLLCNDDQTLLRSGIVHHNVSLGVCAGPDSLGGFPPVERCGCAIMIDPFTLNESCVYGCQYCYAADKTLSNKKRNSTRGLPVLR